MNLTTDSRYIHCPYCGEPIELVIDCSLEQQQYIEDCSVCCQPIIVSVTIKGDGDMHIHACQENE